MEQQLIQLLLDRDFFEASKGRVLRSMFPDSLASIYDTIVEAHNQYGRTLTLDEVRSLHAVHNPLLTRAAKSNIAELFNDLEQSDPVGADVAETVLQHMWKVEVGRNAADIALRIMEGTAELSELQTYIGQVEGGCTASSGDDFMPTDVDAIIELLQTTARWTFNITPLAELCPGLAAGEFMILFARPEMGKTAAHVTLAAGPKGFCEQGAKVLLIVNEEPAQRTILRAMSCCSGKTTEEILADPKAIKEAWNPVKALYHVMDNSEMSIDELDGVVKRLKPDVVIVDQLDKLTVPGDFQRDDQRLGALYIAARRLAKVNGCALIGLTQASADAAGKQYPDFSMIAGSKTGKAAEADVIVAIGKEPLPEDDWQRAWTTSKNKISGCNSYKWGKLDNTISRYS